MLDYPIGTKFVYSDLSFILLAEIAERILGGSIDQISNIYFSKMKMFNTTYLPSKEILWNIAPTEYSSNIINYWGFRQKLIRGVVHDPTAYLFEGVAGHAGIFSTVFDLLLYMQIHLNKGIAPDGTRIYP